jgi:hypothetical protein
MRSPTQQRTFTKGQLHAAQAAWVAWESDASAGMIEEWIPWRKLARQVGIIDPPAGGRYDSWTDDHPSQLAILTRAIRETPELLREALMAPRVRAWFDVIGVLLAALGELAARAEERNRREDEAWERVKAEERASASAALERLGWPAEGGVMSGFVPPSRGNHPERAG